MDFQTIDNYMKGTGLANDPAFDNLHFLNEPIPPMEKKTILGLYFPEGEEPQNQYGYLPPSTIILPPDADFETLRHELGHRHGHYYYGDISERICGKLPQGAWTPTHMRQGCGRWRKLPNGSR